MSTLLHSESDSLSNESINNLESPAPEKVPLSTSTILRKAEIRIAETLETRSTTGNKISIRFQPIGSAPALNPLSFKVSGTQTIGSILKFLMRRLRLKTVHIYVLSSFQPTPDEKLGDLYGMYKTNGELILSYCETVAFG